MANTRNPLPPWQRPTSMRGRAMATGKTQSRTTGGRGPVSKSTGKSGSGVVDKRDPSAWSKLTGGLQSTTTVSPLTMRRPGGNMYTRPEVIGLNQRTTRRPSISEGDLGAAAMRDIDAQKQAAMETRQAAEESIEDVNQQYQEAMTNLRDRMGEINEERSQKFSQVRDRVSDAFDEAMKYTKDQNLQAEEATSELKEAAAEEKEFQRSEFKDTYALRMSTIMKGMRGQLQDDLSMIDEAVARGEITGRGSMGATQVAQQMKEQARQTHLDRISTVAADVGGKYNQAQTQMLSKTADQYLGTMEAATQIEAGTGQQAASTIAQLTSSLAQIMPSIEEQSAQLDLGALQQELAIEQIGVRRPELAAELRLSSAYLPEVVGEYPFWREMYEMQQLATAGENYAPMASNWSVGSNIGMPSSAFQPRSRSGNQSGGGQSSRQSGTNTEKPTSALRR